MKRLCKEKGLPLVPDLSTWSSPCLSGRCQVLPSRLKPGLCQLRYLKVLTLRGERRGGGRRGPWTWEKGRTTHTPAGRLGIRKGPVGPHPSHPDASVPPRVFVQSGLSLPSFSPSLPLLPRSLLGEPHTKFVLRRVLPRSRSERHWRAPPAGRSDPAQPRNPLS